MAATVRSPSADAGVVERQRGVGVDLNEAGAVVVGHRRGLVERQRGVVGGVVQHLDGAVVGDVDVVQGVGGVGRGQQAGGRDGQVAVADAGVVERQRGVGVDLNEAGAVVVGHRRGLVERQLGVVGRVVQHLDGAVVGDVDVVQGVGGVGRGQQAGGRDGQVAVADAGVVERQRGVGVDLNEAGAVVVGHRRGLVERQRGVVGRVVQHLDGAVVGDVDVVQGVGGVGRGQQAGGRDGQVAVADAGVVERQRGVGVDLNEAGAVVVGHRRGLVERQLGVVGRVVQHLDGAVVGDVDVVQGVGGVGRGQQAGGRDGQVAVADAGVVERQRGVGIDLNQAAGVADQFVDQRQDRAASRRDQLATVAEAGRVRDRAAEAVGGREQSGVDDGAAIDGRALEIDDTDDIVLHRAAADDRLVDQLQNMAAGNKNGTAVAEIGGVLDCIGAGERLQRALIGHRAAIDVHGLQVNRGTEIGLHRTGV